MATLLKQLEKRAKEIEEEMWLIVKELKQGEEAWYVHADWILLNEQRKDLYKQIFKLNKKINDT